MQKCLLIFPNKQCIQISISFEFYTQSVNHSQLYCSNLLSSNTAKPHKTTTKNIDHP